MGFLGSKESDTVAILTAQEAAELLDYESPEDMPGKVMSVLVPAISSSIRVATGKDWERDDVIEPLAKFIAGVLLVRWFEDPSLIGEKATNVTGLVIFITQLKAMVGG